MAAPTPIPFASLDGAAAAAGLRTFAEACAALTEAVARGIAAFAPPTWRKLTPPSPATVRKFQAEVAAAVAALEADPAYRAARALYAAKWRRYLRHRAYLARVAATPRRRPR